ncbi:MAG: hypothetical protein WC044_05920 [Crocinitomicaceae bacterium]
MKVKFLFPILIIGLLYLSMQVSSCTKEKVPNVVPVVECPDTIHFQATILPLMMANCSTSGCHDASNGAGGYTLEDHASVSMSADVILTSIRHEGGIPPMPQNLPKLSDADISNFNCWMQQGMLNN